MGWFCRIHSCFVSIPLSDLTEGQQVKAMKAIFLVFTVSIPLSDLTEGQLRLTLLQRGAFLSQFPFPT